MQKIMLGFLIFLSFCFLPNNCWARNNEPVYSTQGVDVDSNIENSQLSKDEKNEQKLKQNRSKKYLADKKKLNKQELKKAKAQRELKYLENRLEKKKTRLESLTTENSKGEKE